MGVDDYISTQLLATHLSQEIDLGCGPGLYTEKLTEKGHTVTGMDFSASSIRYAKESAARKKSNISHLQLPCPETGRKISF